MTGPLAGIRILELAGIGPGPFAAMLLADLGADVVRVNRASDVLGVADGPHPDITNRGRRCIAVDLKHADGCAVVLDLVESCDALIEGFRPGVTERLGLGPEDCWARNPALVYGRMTGWGQTGPLSLTAGHDIGYIALTGALDGIRRAGERPVPPMNLLGDLGGGALFLALGLVSALLEARRSGQGQVVDAAIVDGTAALTNFILGLRAMGAWSNPPGANLLDTGAPFYDVYTCADGREIAVGALEPKFYAELLRLSGIPPTAELDPTARFDESTWPEAKRQWAAHFVTRTRDEWWQIFQGSDACVAPVLSMDEAALEPHNVERATFAEHAGLVQAAPAPRFSRTPATLGHPPAHAGQHTDEILADLGRSAHEIAALRQTGAVA